MAIVSKDISQAIIFLSAEALVAIPTETSYSLVCNIYNASHNLDKQNKLIIITKQLQYHQLDDSINGSIERDTKQIKELFKV